jgi:tetratricopeptide (TPR) repeat protein
MNIRISAIALACLVGMAVSADPRMEQGARFEAKGDFEMALGEYRAVLAENPRNAEAYFAAAQVRMKMKDFSGALANYRLAYKFEPSMSAAYEGAAKVYEALGQKAKADAERAKDPKNNPVAEAPAETPAPVAEAPAAAPEPAPAPVAETPKPEPKPVEVAKPEHAPVEVKTVETPKSEPKVAEPAKVEPAKTETALPTDPFEKGKALFAEGKYKEAAPLWREVLRKQPGHAGAYFYAGLTRYELGEMDKAEFNLKKGLEYKEEGNDANFFLARIAQKNNKPEQELKFLAAYMKRAAPGAKYRTAAEERIAEIKAAKEGVKAESKTAESVAATAEPKTEAKAPETVPVADAPAQVAEAPVKDFADAPSSTPTLANANLLFSAGSIEAALKMYKALLETEQEPEDRYFTMLQMGNAYRELRDFHSAVVRYREVVQQFPDSDWATEAERALEDAVWLEKHASELPRRVR